MMVYNDVVSIIVPIYNAELYLEQCIDSILNQTYKDIEVILINDGSKDNSGMICDKYAKMDNRIKVIHQKNSGPSFARNTGINCATGKYIQFVDADDTIKTDMIEKLVHAAKPNNELVVCGYKIFTKDQENLVVQDISPPKNGILSTGEFLEYFGEFYKNGFINPLWNKLYIKEIIVKNSIQFIYGLNMGEDLLFNLEYIRCCNNINFIQDRLYNYLIINNNQSLTKTFIKDFFGNQQMLFRKVEEFLKTYNSFTGQNKKLVETVYTERILGVFHNLFHNNSDLTFKQRKEQIINIINDNTVRDKVKYFIKDDNVQKRFIGYMIKYKKINIIYFFFKIKELLRTKMTPVFNWLKKKI
jgi:glycosyltransferase involved in cell wall biosynthesis